MMGECLLFSSICGRQADTGRWYIRHTEWLEETDQSGAMEGNAWRLQALGPGGM